LVEKWTPPTRSETAEIGKKIERILEVKKLFTRKRRIALVPWHRLTKIKNKIE
jgi:hypothetical protein